MSELILYNYWLSTSSYRVRIALALKGLPYVYVPVDLLRDEQSAAAHAARSPTENVPCLVIDGVSYVESVAIVELLEERFPSPQLYPTGSHDRARVRALVEIVNSGTQPLHNRHVLLHRSPELEVRKAWAVYFVDRGLRAFERAMERDAAAGIRGRFAYGDAPTAADAFLVPQVHFARRYGVDLSAFPRLKSAADAAAELEAVKQAAPELQPDAS